MRAAQNSAQSADLEAYETNDIFPWLNVDTSGSILVVFDSLFSSSTSSDMPHRLSLGRMVNQSTMLLMVCIGSLILLLALLILFHENANATKGYDLRNLEADRKGALLEQEVLASQISEAQALNNLQNDEQIKQMIPVAKPLYAKAAPTVAMKDTR